MNTKIEFVANAEWFPLVALGLGEAGVILDSWGGEYPPGTPVVRCSPNVYWFPTLGRCVALGSGFLAETKFRHLSPGEAIVIRPAN